MSFQLDQIEHLRSQYQQEMTVLRQTFDRTSDGTSAVRRRSAVVDRIASQLWNMALPENPSDIALVATGGFGRRELFPHSDIDILYLFATPEAENIYHAAIRDINQAMWDIGLRASPAARTLKECDKYDPDNIEFTLSLIDRRFLAGSFEIYQKLQKDILPSLLQREWLNLVHRLAEIARARHAKFGNTIFHLEPSLKDCPGGLRDYHFAQWFDLLTYLHENKEWPRTGSALRDQRGDAESAFNFLAAARCFLHFRHGRDDNTLDWQSQDEAAANSIGLETGGSADPSYWMRTYYRHARAIHRRAILMMDALPPVRVSFYKQLRRKRTPIPATDFFLEEGRVDIAENTQLSDSDGILRLFASIAAHGYKLSQTAEERIAEALPVLAIHMPEGPFLWNCLREILLGPHAAHALRTMHALGILEMLIPEFHGIDALVIRDSYHRYTVDEHTFLAIDNIHGLLQPTHDWERRLAQLLSEVDRRDLFLLALLMHDTGKARRTGNHMEQSVELTESLLARLDFDAEEKDTVRRLIRHHIEMSGALRRDIFDLENIRDFAEKIGSPMKLRMLTLLTYADIKAVNPDALTPWKAENLMQLYMSTVNFMDRSVDEVRYHSDVDPTLLIRIRAVVPAQPEELRQYLEGIPQRYLQTRLPEQIRDHFLMASKLAEEPVQLELRVLRQLFEITVITRDRPGLFADVAGVLSAWGMNIVKADAFANDEGVIVDSFQFTDLFRTLELNPEERDRFMNSIRDVVLKKVPVDQLLNSRRMNTWHGHHKLEHDVRLEFDDESSSHSTLLQVVSQDTPGLLRKIGLTLGLHKFNIEVALIDTEGEMAIDVFYVTSEGKKLNPAQREALANDLHKALEGSPKTVST